MQGKTWFGIIGSKTGSFTGAVKCLAASLDESSEIDCGSWNQHSGWAYKRPAGSVFTHFISTTACHSALESFAVKAGENSELENQAHGETGSREKGNRTGLIAPTAITVWLETDKQVRRTPPYITPSCPQVVPATFPNLLLTFTEFLRLHCRQGHQDENRKLKEEPPVVSLKIHRASAASDQKWYNFKI